MIMLVLWATNGAYAQTFGPGNLSGQLLDTAARQAMEGASVRLLQVNGTDTVAAAGTVARGNGRFSIAHIPLGRYILSVTFQGYQDWSGTVILTNHSPVIRKVVYMRPAASELSGIVVRDTRPVRVHGDTTAYQADQFHTRPNGVLSDLIQKMPGIDVTRSGTVIAQGDTVKRILVNGKRFFSNNLQVALKYLPKDIIAQIEIFDDKSDQAKFTGVDDGVRIRTINIVLKRQIKSGTFGKISAGLGTAGDGSSGLLYDNNASVNRFQGESMTSLIGNANNTSPVMGGQIRSLSGGLNFSDKLGKRTQVSGSYQENNTLTQTTTGSYTENLIPGDSSIYSTQHQTSRSTNNQQQVDLNIETDVDSANHLTVRGNGGYGTSSSNTQSVTSSTSGVTTPLNSSNNVTGSTNNSTNGSLYMLWGHRFAKKGRTLSLAATVNTTQGNGTGTNQYQNTYYKPGQPDSLSAVNQYYLSPNDNTQTSLTLSYTEPLSRHSSLLFDYEFTDNHARTGRSTYQWDSATHAFDQPDTLLTNLFSNVYQSEQGGVKYHYGDKRLQVTAGLGLQLGDNDSRNQSNGTDLTQRYTNLYPLATLNFTPAKGENLRLDYQGRTVQPPLTALEPLVNNSDPLNVVIGNPHLDQAFTHMINLSFNHFDPVTFHHLFAAVNASLTENMVVNHTAVDALTGVDTTTYVNLNGNYSLGGYLDYGFRLKHPSSNISFGATLSDQHSVGYINNVLNGTSNYTIGGMLKWTSNLEEHLDLNFTESPQYTIAVYSAEPSQNTRYLTDNLDMDGLYYTKSGWELGSDVHYTTYSGRPVGFNTTTFVWNLSLAHLFFKHSQGELKFTVHDVLDQAQGVSQSITPTMIQNTQGSMLGRYYLLSFTYNLKGLGKGGKKPVP